MKRNNIDNLIIYLIAIKNYAKDIHYNCSGYNFYGNHLLADRIANKIEEYIDELKEVCLLGHNLIPLDSKEYLQRVINFLPEKVYDFRILRDLLRLVLEKIETFEELSKGDENLIGAIAQDIQNNVGLINIMFGEVKK